MQWINESARYHFRLPLPLAPLTGFAARGLGSSVIDIREIPVCWTSRPVSHGWLGDDLIASRQVAGHEALRGRDAVEVPRGEEYAANCIRINGAVLVAGGFPKTAALLRDLGYDLAELEMSEYRKMDGGLSCLSVRW